MKIPKKCTSCGSSTLHWLPFNKTRSGAIDGRLQSHDVTTMFAVACEDCDTTIKTFSPFDVAEFLNATTQEAGDE